MYFILSRECVCVLTVGCRLSSCEACICKWHFPTTVCHHLLLRFFHFLTLLPFQKLSPLGICHRARAIDGHSPPTLSPLIFAVPLAAYIPVIDRSVTLNFCSCKKGGHLYGVSYLPTSTLDLEPNHPQPHQNSDASSLTPKAARPSWFVSSSTSA